MILKFCVLDCGGDFGHIRVSFTILLGYYLTKPGHEGLVGVGEQGPAPNSQWSVPGPQARALAWCVAPFQPTGAERPGKECVVALSLTAPVFLCSMFAHLCCPWALITAQGPK